MILPTTISIKEKGSYLFIMCFGGHLYCVSSHSFGFLSEFLISAYFVQLFQILATYWNQISIPNAYLLLLFVDFLFPQVLSSSSYIFMFLGHLSGTLSFLPVSVVQVSALILENTFTSILDMAGVLLPFLKWFIGKSPNGPRILNFLVRSPWSTIDIVGQVRLLVGWSS